MAVRSGLYCWRVALEVCPASANCYLPQLPSRRDVSSCRKLILLFASLLTNDAGRNLAPGPGKSTVPLSALHYIPFALGKIRICFSPFPCFLLVECIAFPSFQWWNVPLGVLGKHFTLSKGYGRNR